MHVHCTLLKDTFNEQIVVQKATIIHINFFSILYNVICKITSMTFKNSKHSIILCMQLFPLCKYGVTNENDIGLRTIGTRGE